MTFHEMRAPHDDGEIKGSGDQGGEGREMMRIQAVLQPQEKKYHA